MEKIELQVGTKFWHPTYEKDGDYFIIIKIDGSMITYQHSAPAAKAYSLNESFLRSALSQGYEVRQPNTPGCVDFAPSSKSSCPHKNPRKDYFFSGKQYITCKDCGQALN